MVQLEIGSIRLLVILQWLVKFKSKVFIEKFTKTRLGNKFITFAFELNCDLLGFSAEIFFLIRVAQLGIFKLLSRLISVARRKSIPHI
jgi:hypothetical protein